MKILTYFFIILIVNLSCNKKNISEINIKSVDVSKPNEQTLKYESNSKEMPSDFYFSFRDFTDYYNSKEKKFKRQFSGEIKNVSVDLHKNDLKKIYEIISSDDFKNLPNTVECDFVYTQPVTYIDIEFFVNKKIYQKSFLINISEKNCRKVEPALKIKEILTKSIYQDPKIKQLEDSNIYLE